MKISARYTSQNIQNKIWDEGRYICNDVRCLRDYWCNSSFYKNISKIYKNLHAAYIWSDQWKLEPSTCIAKKHKMIRCESRNTV